MPQFAEDRYGEVARIVHEHYMQMCGREPVLSSDTLKVLAGIVLTDEQAQEAHVLSVGTGTFALSLVESRPVPFEFELV